MELVWGIIFLGPALAFAVSLVLVVIPSTSLEMSATIPIIVATSALAAAGYFFSRRPGLRRHRVFFLVAVNVVLTFLFVFLLQAFAPVTAGHITCPVCGYVALPAVGDTCNICAIDLTDERMKSEEYDTHEEMVRAEQVLYFMPTSDGEEINFFEPSKFQGYEKDPNWQPRTSVEEIEEIRKLANPKE